MIKAILSAAALSLLLSLGASASPVSSTKQLSTATSSDLVQSGKKYGKGRYGRGGYGKRKYGKRGRYGKWDRGRNYGRYGRGGPPPGWRSYSYRAHRGCLAFGPVWYCP